MQHVSAPYGIPTPPASPLSFDHRCAFQQPIQTHHQQHLRPARYVPVAPEERIGSILAGTLQLTGILGTGAYGVVYQAIDIKTNVRYAVKTLSKFNADGTPLDRRQQDFQTREIRLHYTASAHRNVVSMLKIIDEPDCIFVILEFCPEGDLFFNITECGQYVGKDALAKKVFLQILDAVEHCHSLGIYHRDLKPENILVTDQGETVKLADFGLATSQDRSEDYGCGSTFYMSPECLDHNTTRPFYFCAPNDVWSLGVILVNLTCGRNPWKQASEEDSTYRAYARNPAFLKSILPVSDELNDILGRVFTRNPDHRITLSELKARILACVRFTEQPTVTVPQAMPSAPPAAPVYAPVYVDEDYDLLAPLSPASSDDSLSDDGSSCSSDDEGSLSSSSSSCSTLDEFDDEDLCQDLPDMLSPMTPPPQSEGPTVNIFEPEDVQLRPFQQQQASPEYVPFQQPICAPDTFHHPISVPQPSYPAKFNFWDWSERCAPLFHPVPFHHQLPLFPIRQH